MSASTLKKKAGGEHSVRQEPVYRVQIDPSGVPIGLWLIDHDKAVSLDKGRTADWQGRDGLSAFDTMKERAPVWFLNGAGFHDLTLEPGQCYARMVRPHAADPESTAPFTPSSHWERKDIAVSLGQLRALKSHLQRICQTVHPGGANMQAYGHEIRNLLILICTEIESQWRGILKDNGYSKPKGDLNANDYVKLVAAMRLDEFTVEFFEYPWLVAVQPFAGWIPDVRLAESLPWYDAYNAVKHDREQEFERATLDSVFTALAACVVMLSAQFGRSTVLKDSLDDFFLVAHPLWNAADAYYAPLDGGRWRVLEYPFRKRSPKS